MTKKETVQRGGRPSKRDFILECAEQLVQEQGAAHLTFDALTIATGISKGGLLYHFASKNDLIEAMLIRYVERRQALRRESLWNDHKEYKNPVDAEMQALMKSEIAHNKKGKLGMDSAILVAAATNPQMMDMIRDKHEDLYRLFDQSSCGPIQARVAWYALIGHRIWSQFGLTKGDQGNDEAFLQYISQLVEPK